MDGARGVAESPDHPPRPQRKGGCRTAYLVEIAAAAAVEELKLRWSLSEPRARALGHQKERGGGEHRVVRVVLVLCGACLPAAYPPCCHLLLYERVGDGPKVEYA